MLTLFTTAKPFVGQTKVLQMNALTSWRELGSNIEVIIFGDEEGVSEAALELGFRREPFIERTEEGTPRVDCLFRAAERLARNNVLCYVNADIILFKDLLHAAETVTLAFKRFLVVGQRIDLDGNLDYCETSNAESRDKLIALARNRGTLHGPTGLDYFIFPKGLWSEILPFAIGRTMWDNWLLYKARSLHSPVIDATEVVTAIHQNHDFSHHLAGEKGIWRGPEARKNVEMAGGYDYAFDLRDATHVLTRRGLTRALDRAYLRRRYEKLPLLHPRAARILFPARDTFFLPVRAARKAWRMAKAGWAGPR